MRFHALVAILLLAFCCDANANDQFETGRDAPPKQPNILWLFQEDLSPWLGCYGYDIQSGHTPNIDQMAKHGVRFSRAFVPSPVCSTCRSAMITGCSQIRFGAHEHRSRRGEAELPLPEGMRGLPELMTDAGYFCFNIGKTDYNFEHASFYQKVDKKLNKRPWKACPDGKPFFGQIQLRGGKLNTRKFEDKCDRSKVTIPADYPQTEIYREVVAEHFDSARLDDANIGKILAQLEEDGLTDSTIVVYFSDHGANNLVRHKQQPTEGGSHVPFIITGPDPWVPAASVRDDLVSMLDLSATTLHWAGIKQPEWFEGQYLFHEKYVPREFVATARDRCDQTIERIRSIRTDRFRYTRNYLLDRVLLQPQYRDKQKYVIELRELYSQGKLAPKLAEIYFGERPPEELYDVKADPAQLYNLVGDPKFADELDRHRKLMDQWLSKGDKGAGQEPEIELRMADSKKWGRGVNPEYESIRVDTDGDGLSDDWETINGRDARDGRLRFDFECGGWQTEGWTSAGSTDNIAGPLGVLEFGLLNGSAKLKRDGLKLDPTKNKGDFVLEIQASLPTKIKLRIDDQLLAEQTLAASNQITAMKFPMPSTSSDPIETIQIDFDSDTGARVKIAEIRIDVPDAKQ